MRLTKRGEYALRTLIRPGVAQRMGSPIASASRPAGYEGIHGKSGGAKFRCDLSKARKGERVRLLSPAKPRNADPGDGFLAGFTRGLAQLSTLSGRR